VKCHGRIRRDGTFFDLLFKSHYRKTAGHCCIFQKSISSTLASRLVPEQSLRNFLLPFRPRSEKDRFLLNPIHVSFSSHFLFLSTAGEIRALVSGVLAAQASHSGADSPGGSGVGRGSTERPLTVGDVVESVRLLVRVRECQAFGYLSVEGELVLLVAPVTRKPTDLQVSIAADNLCRVCRSPVASVARVQSVHCRERSLQSRDSAFT
jgi:hypothetical protein